MEPQLNECQIAADLRARVVELEAELEEIKETWLEPSEQPQLWPNQGVR
jgi:hypothetical protein